MQTLCQLNEFKIIHQDAYLVAIHKPAGLLVHPSPIAKQETQFATHLLKTQLQQSVYPIHRLDRATSGLLIFALDRLTAHELSKQFQNHSIHKHYLAIVRGWTKPHGEIHLPLKQHHDKILTHTQHNKPDQAASTYWQTLSTCSLDLPLNKFTSQRYSLIQLTPTTGRKHQLRRHLNAISHPIIGDVNHGDRHHNHLFFQQLSQHRLYLAATELHLTHPKTNTPLSLKAPLEPSFMKACHYLNLQTP